MFPFIVDKYSVHIQACVIIHIQCYRYFKMMHDNGEAVLRNM